MRITLLAIAFLLVSAATALAFTKDGTIYSTDGSQADVEAAIADAYAGDTVNIPSGEFTWGASADYVALNKAITLQGAGTNSTTINISATSGTYTAALIRITAAATVKSFTVAQSGAATTSAFSTGTTDGWRITDILYNSGATAGYFVYAGNHGLIDHCTINGGSGSDEWIFTRGPTNSWQTASSLGTTNAVYIEDCTFNVQGYTDFNSNARAVVRYCVITARIKIDGHGLASNTPARGVRHVEIYGNEWTDAATDGGAWAAVELRGGSGIIWGNTSANTSSGRGYFRLHEYGCTGLWSNFGSQYQTLFDYPITDQIGVGIDPKVGGGEPVYFFSNVKGGVKAPVSWQTVPADAIAWYQTQTGDAEATFTMPDVIAADRDWFDESAAFDGSSGVGVGTAAEMAAITPTLTGVGFWVTDEADWNTTVEGADGQLYVWDGDSWDLYYTPLTYPHPLSDGYVPSAPDTNAPAISAVSATPASTSAFVTWTTDENATSGLEWGLTAGYGSSSTNSAAVTSHSLNATSLSASTTYHFRVHSTDASGNSAVSDDATFETDAQPAAPEGSNIGGGTITGGSWGR